MLINGEISFPGVFSFVESLKAAEMRQNNKIEAAITIALNLYASAAAKLRSASVNLKRKRNSFSVCT